MPSEKLNFKNVAKPIYQSLAEEFRKNISSNVWKSGDQLPSEEWLTKQYQVSRGTVRRAIGILVEEGILERVQGRGTFVSFNKISYPFSQELISFAEEMKLRGQVFTTEVLKTEVIAPNKLIFEKLRAKPKERVFNMTRVRSIEGKPVTLIHNWVRLSKCPKIQDEDFTKVGLFETIEKLMGTKIKYGTRKFSAKAMNKEEAKLLGKKAGDPVLLMSQITYGQDNEPIECSNFLLRTDQYQVCSTLYR
jgi:GntR family transcriptional regulator